ncbi:MAG: 30S ribosomal protein S3 [Spirochaetales bacterium]|nr:MAG: 30S ribosomal protein S3 [Spirochaetales bacterium]
MGQKVNPIGLRLGINKDWKSRWYVDPRDYAKTLHEDLGLRKRMYALPEARNADISEIEIVRHPQRVTIVIHTAKPGVLIGQKGANIERIGLELQKYASKKINIKIKEIKKVETNAQIVAQGVCRQLEGRGSFRRTMKMAVGNAMKGGSQGCKVRMSGRLGGADMSRTEEYKEGRVPLHTLRADIDYGFYEANTTYGKIGVKVWICKNDNALAGDKKDDAGLMPGRSRREHSDRSDRGERPARSPRTGPGPAAGGPREARS